MAYCRMALTDVGEIGPKAEVIRKSTNQKPLFYENK